MGGGQEGKSDRGPACGSGRVVQETGRRNSAPRGRGRGELGPQRVWFGPDGGRSKRSLEWRSHRPWCRCQEGKTECRSFLHGVGPSSISATGRLQERHGQVSSRVEELPEGGRPITNLHSRREELREDGKVPEGRYSTESQGC